MVSIWPWKGDENSPAAFEKTLSNLSTKISKSQLQLDSLRQSSRRVKALWTLYTSFAYLLCALILGLVVGWKNWGITEYSALSGSPVVIYMIRASINAYYTYRIDTVTARLEEQQTERARTIDKLKAATKYNSTQQLLEKYGGAPPQPLPKPKATPARKPKQNENKPQRTSMGPPATANIPRNQPAVSSPISARPDASASPNTPMQKGPHMGPQPGPPEFAPNAFPSMPQYERGGETGSEGNWYDRILDVLLGDDETSPKNRIILICQNCRLVNGQAPPGIRHLEELGKWRCNACGAWNGEVDEGTKIVAEIKEMEKSQNAPETEESEHDEIIQESTKSEEDNTDEVDEPAEEDEKEPNQSDSDERVAKSTRRKTKNSRAKS